LTTVNAFSSGRLFFSKIVHWHPGRSGVGKLFTWAHASSHFLQPTHRVRSTRQPKGSGGALDVHASADFGAAAQTPAAPMNLKKFRLLICIISPYVFFNP
jgi:hypothetical protein